MFCLSPSFCCVSVVQVIHKFLVHCSSAKRHMKKHKDSVPLQGWPLWLVWFIHFSLPCLFPTYTCTWSISGPYFSLVYKWDHVVFFFVLVSLRLCLWRTSIRYILIHLILFYWVYWYFFKYTVQLTSSLGSCTFTWQILILIFSPYPYPPFYLILFHWLWNIP